MDIARLLFGQDTWRFLSVEGPHFVVAVLLSLFCGLLLGYERERKEKPAGLRTFTLITMGSTAFVLSSRMLAGDLFDPARMAAQIVTGVGFIGGGAIFRMRGLIQGITTAATIWVAAAIGILIGTGHYVLGVVFTVISYGVLAIVPVIEAQVAINSVYETIKIHLTTEGQKKGWVFLKELFERQNATVEYDPDKSFMLVRIYMQHAINRQPLIDCSQSEFVEKIELLGAKPHASSENQTPQNETN